MTVPVKIECVLPEPALEKRIENDVAGLISSAKKIEELDDGYALFFPAENALLERVVRFVLEERTCCSFFEFNLVFPPESGDVSLTISGPNGIKAFIKQMLPNSLLSIENSEVSVKNG